MCNVEICSEEGFVTSGYYADVSHSIQHVMITKYTF